MKPSVVLAALLLAGCTAAPTKQDDYRSQYAKYRAARESGTCHVHRVAMTKAVVPIQYGLPAGQEAGPDPDTRMKEFPFTRRPPMGGCEITPDAPRTAEISVCPECVAAEERWMAMHPKRP